MARSHHRKKHKEHLRQFQHNHDHVTTATPKGKSVQVFIIIGAIAGLAIGYFASERALTWSIVGTIAGGLVGYLFGHSVDAQNNKKS
ncbi:MAG: glycine zipper domain-containing protein [Chitinophagaceae bacterium]